MVSDNLYYSILKTLSYSDIFDFPLGINEIYRYLIHSNPASRNEIKRILHEADTVICMSGNYYYLKGREHIVRLRENKQKYSKDKLRKARDVSALLTRIPFIKLIGISGSLSMQNSEKEDDIDLFIISSRNTLWITRLLTFLILAVKKAVRTRTGSIVRDKICVNMILSEDNISLGKKGKNIFLAHEIVQLKVLVNKDNTFEKFLIANEWVKKYLPNSLTDTHPVSLTPFAISHSYKRTGIWRVFFFLEESLLYAINNILYILQYAYMRKHISNELIRINIAKFHPRDKTDSVIKTYKKKYNYYKMQRDYFDMHKDQNRVLPIYSRLLTC